MLAKDQEERLANQNKLAKERGFKPYAQYVKRLCKDNIAESANCFHRIKSVNDKLTKEKERIGTLNAEHLIKRLELTTDIHNMWTSFSTDQLRHLNTILLLESNNHDMSIVMCKCAKDLEISVPENIESPNQFQEYMRTQIKIKRMFKV